MHPCSSNISDTSDLPKGWCTVAVHAELGLHCSCAVTACTEAILVRSKLFLALTNILTFAEFCHFTFIECLSNSSREHIII